MNFLTPPIQDEEYFPSFRFIYFIAFVKRKRERKSCECDIKDDVSQIILRESLISSTHGNGELYPMETPRYHSPLFLSQQVELK